MAEHYCLIAAYPLKMLPKVCVHGVAEFEMIQVSLLKQIGCEYTKAFSITKAYSIFIVQHNKE